ncbi:hypothetical protein BGZ70_005674 [Mortierella alpina]|uniref:NADP-dependent oxidoreductase domain-containing protein n=1 Tax=Mortierella alpina TaxID=64518 RepID=A0A9P6J8Q4_MORAP|nr:hypothetical protein BGZ70_005674 [Mortierella alpina]
MSVTKPTPRIIFGTQSFALETTDPKQSDFRVQGAENLKPFLDCLESFGVLELDTARVYCGGDTETVIGQVEGQPLSRFEISTKIYPLQPGDHAPEALVKSFHQSLEQLKVDKVKIFYLHAPDFFTPFEVTLKTVDELYRQGRFEQFGLSNFAAWQVAFIHQICHYNGYVKPTVYQGWAGGFLAGKYTIDGPVNDGTRFDTKTLLGSYYREQYWSPLYFAAVAALKTVANAHGIPVLEASIRWLNHHSPLGPGDGMIFGANDRVEDLRESLVSLQQGPLPQEVVQAFDDAWEKVKAGNQTYFRRDIRTPAKETAQTSGDKVSECEE